MNPADFIGCRFGMLTVVEDSGRRKGHSVLWRCECDCGGKILAVRSQLVSGRLTDCGCMPKQTGSQVADLIGKRFGKLIVTGDSGQRSGSGEILWLCKCDCGGELLTVRNRLISGYAASCGCVPRQYASKRMAEDLTGRQFGDLTAVRRVENDRGGRTCWLCRCSCGQEVVVQAMRLKSGHTRSCGCKRYESAVNKRDLSGRRFGRLTVLDPVKRGTKPTKLVWHCRCDCGCETDVYAESLLRGITRSCGCWNKEQSMKMHDHMHYRDDTCVERLKRVQLDSTRSKAGFRGLFITKSGRYRVMINFQKKHYTLGYYETFEEAVQVRLDAEQVLQVGYINAFKRYEEKAKEDPVWAEGHPFYFNVIRSKGDFQVQTNI